MPSRTASRLGTPSILLTGFGPFPGIEANASARLAGLLARRARRRWPQARITSAILPTEWRRGPDRLAVLWETLTPDVALHFGVSSKAAGLDIEIVGRNLCADHDDACEKRPVSFRHAEDGPETYSSTFPAREIVAALAAREIPGCISDDAGTYLCNAILYRSLRHAASPPAAPNTGTTPSPVHRLGAGRTPRKSPSLETPAPALVGFIHIPACLVGGGADGNSPLPGCPLDWPQALDGAMLALETTLAALE